MKDAEVNIEIVKILREAGLTVHQGTVVPALPMLRAVFRAVNRVAPDPLTRETEPPVGTWVKDRFGASCYHQPDGWGQPGTMPYGKWPMMWDARGPYVECGPWGRDVVPEGLE